MAVTRKRLVLLRHAKSAWPEVPDHERPLAARGRRDAPAAGRWLRDSNCVPDQVLCSTAKRARQTWRLAQSALGASPEVGYEEAIYGASIAGLLDVVRLAPGAAGTVLVVGHDPGIQGLALALIGADSSTADPAAADPAQEAAAAERMLAKFPTAAIAVLEFDRHWSELAERTARLTDFVTPREMPHDSR